MSVIEKLRTLDRLKTVRDKNDFLRNLPPEEQAAIGRAVKARALNVVAKAKERV